MQWPPEPRVEIGTITPPVTEVASTAKALQQCCVIVGRVHGDLCAYVDYDKSSENRYVHQT